MTVTVASARFSPRTGTSVSESANTPHEALSAMVSQIPIRQSLMRESTISKQAITVSVASRTSAADTPGPRSGRARRNAISASARGAISAEVSTTPSRTHMASVRNPKSGW